MEMVAGIDKDTLKGILFALNKGNKIVTYGDLSKIIERNSGRRINPHMGFNVSLDRIQDYCIESNVPCLSALVVSQNQVPGPGFIDYYRKTNPQDARSDQDILADEQKACRENEDWLSLLKRCDIEVDELWDIDVSELDAEALNWSALVSILDQYESNLRTQRSEEVYKWEALMQFQNYWDIDASDFHAMLCESLSKTENLLTSGMYYARGMIEIFADNNPDAVRAAFKMLLDNSIPLGQRMERFSAEMDEQLKALNEMRRERGAQEAKNHYQDPHAMSVYLALAQDDEHYIYKARPYESFAARVGAKAPKNKHQKVKSFETICDTILDYLLTRRSDLVRKSDDLLSEGQRRADSSHHMLAQDIVFYASPKIWSFSDIEPGAEQTYTVLTDNGTPRRIHSNLMAAKEGDLVIGYEATPTKKVVAICEISRDTDEKNLYFRKLKDLVEPVPYSTIKDDELLSQSQFMKNPNGSLFALTEEEFQRVLELASDDAPISPIEKAKPYTDEQFLSEVYVSKEDLETMKRVLTRKKNLILQGAPGTGKTYCARRLAWDFMGEEDDSRICFVQFHQNSAYDDMMAGFRPAEDGGFEATPGEFLRFCDKAAQDPKRRPWFFIIDEINRANISKVFGELLMLIESSHRDEPIKLSILGRTVRVPSNLYLIGMMNTADRGLALIDYALRRRFAFFEMEPAFGNEQFEHYMESTGSDGLIALARAVEKLNEEIESDLAFGSGFRIGHSYFCFDGDVTEESLKDVVEFELAPLVQEYWFDAPSTAKEKIEKLRAAL